MISEGDKCWLLAAEADQIQDLVFRSSELREVEGGSQLLERFCQEAPEALIAYSDYAPDHGGGVCNVIIKRAGAFRIVFADERQALSFGRLLAEAYRQFTGGILSVAKPECYHFGSYSEYEQCQNLVQRNLAKSKRAGTRPSVTPQIPYSAFCASCGQGYAAIYRARPGVDDDNNKENYLCGDCDTRFEESYTGMSSNPTANSTHTFLDKFRSSIRSFGSNGELKRPRDGDWAGVISKCDTNHMVAYLAADGNSIGRLFSSCRSPEMSSMLSDGMEKVMRNSLANATSDLIKNKPKLITQIKKTTAATSDKTEKEFEDVLPVLPLILGGDDIFLLLPAPWAVDFTHKFTLYWEEQMGYLLEEVKSFAAKKFDVGDEVYALFDIKPSICSSLVFCKGNYPHSLAHRRCIAELKRAKQTAYSSESAASESVINYAVITGNQTGGGVPLEYGRTVNTLSPFTCSSKLIDRLIYHRKSLNNLPTGRLHQFQDLFETATSEIAKFTKPILEKNWNIHLSPLLERIGRNKADLELVEKALEDLGNKSSIDFGWRKMVPTPPWLSETHTECHGHGFPDLIRLWPYLNSLSDETKEQVDDDRDEKQ